MDGHAHDPVTSVPFGGGLPRRADFAIGLLLALFATIVSGSFLLHAADLHLPASSEPWDAAIYPWNFFWLKESFGARDGSILYTQRFFWPAGEGLGLYTPTYVYGVLSLPFQWLLAAPESRQVAVAALLWFSSFATALLSYALARESNRTKLASFFVALLVTVASGRMMNAARLNLFCTEFLLLYAWLGLRLWKRPSLARGAAVGCAAALLLLQSQPLCFQALIATTLFVVAALARRASRHLLRACVKPLLVASFVFLLLTFPFLWEMAKEMRTTPGFQQAASRTIALSLDLGDLVRPNVGDRFASAYATLFGVTPRAASFFELGGPLGTVSHFLGVGWIALALLGALRRDSPSPRRALWFALGVLSFAVGPILHWCGRELPVPTPYLLLSWFPPLTLDKSPTRLVFLAELGLALAAAGGVEWLWFARDGARRRVGAWIAGLLALATLVEQGETVPLRSIDPPFHVPAEIAALAHEPGNFAVLDLPYDGLPPSGHQAYRIPALAMACGAAHERPIFVGLYPRATRPKEPELAARPLFGAIHAREKAAAIDASTAVPLPPLSKDEIAAARRDLAELDVGAVLLHDLDDAQPATRREATLLREFLRQLEPKSETVLAPGPGYSLTLFRF